MIRYALGTSLVSYDEIRQRDIRGEFDPGPLTKDVTLSNGVLTSRDLDSLRFTATSRSPTSDPGVEAEPVNSPPNTFQPIGPGLPLTIGLREVYTGRNPHGFYIGDRGMLMASAVKTETSYGAAPRAVNYLQQTSQPRTRMRDVDATTVGTPLIWYTPALTVLASVVTVEMMFDGFPADAFNAVAKLFSGAGSIPLFATAGTYLLAAGNVTKLIGSLGKSIFNGKPVLSQTEPINFVTPGSDAPVARFVLLTRDGADPSMYDNYKINPSGSLVSMDKGIAYGGDEPYIILYLNGRAVDQYKDFAPTAASAALLDRFYNLGDGQSQPADILLSAMKVVNDVKFRQDAQRLKEQIDKLPAASAERPSLQAQYDALVKNILDDSLKP